MEILKASREDKENLINSCHEIYGACRHKAKFHRFIKNGNVTNNTNTDDGGKPERVDNNSVDRATSVCKNVAAEEGKEIQTSNPQPEHASCELQTLELEEEEPPGDSQARMQVTVVCV